jgi:glycosyltransferase involved in cell wall biosynthesis
MVFAGGGYLGDALRELDDPSVEVLGILTTAQVQAEMSRAWGLVLPSRADTSPNVVKEARVIGLPVIVSPHGGHAGYVENHKDGILIESSDLDEWFNALDTLSSDYQLCRAMGDARHEFYRQHFRPETTANEFLNLYRDIS